MSCPSIFSLFIFSFPILLICSCGVYIYMHHRRHSTLFLVDGRSRRSGGRPAGACFRSGGPNAQTAASHPANTPSDQGSIRVSTCVRHDRPYSRSPRSSCPAQPQYVRVPWRTQRSIQHCHDCTGRINSCAYMIKPLKLGPLFFLSAMIWCGRSFIHSLIPAIFARPLALLPKANHPCRVINRWNMRHYFFLCQTVTTK
jgi:hypothetical protein